MWFADRRGERCFESGCRTRAVELQGTSAGGRLSNGTLNRFTPRFGLDEDCSAVDPRFPTDPPRERLIDEALNPLVASASLEPVRLMKSYAGNGLSTADRHGGETTSRPMVGTPGGVPQDGRPWCDRDERLPSK